MVMRHIFQAKWWEKHPRVCSFNLLRPRKLEKEKGKALERQNGIFGTFIYENKGN